MTYKRHKKKIIPALLALFLLASVPTLAEDAPAPAESHAPATVAVIDSGLDEDNPALDYSHILPGKSYVEGVDSCEDRVGHGTAVAGLIQEYAPDADILPLMFYTRYISGVPENGGVDAICKAIYDAVDVYGCKIINLSLGIYTDDGDLKKAVGYAEAKDVIVVSAVGNDNLTQSGRVYYPAAYPTVVGVGAVDDKNDIAPFSQRNTSVMTVGQGVEVRVPSIRNVSDYTMASGTSYAAAEISGMAADVVERYPDITPEQFRQLIKISCKDLGDAGYDTDYGYGALDEELMMENFQKIDSEQN